MNHLSKDQVSQNSSVILECMMTWRHCIFTCFILNLQTSPSFVQLIKYYNKDMYITLHLIVTNPINFCTIESIHLYIAM